MEEKKVVEEKTKKTGKQKQPGGEKVAKEAATAKPKESTKGKGKKSKKVAFIKEKSSSNNYPYFWAVGVFTPF